MRLICITGGIGAGKSVVSMILRLMGYSVYDCDSRAKAIMQTDVGVKSTLMDLFGADIFDEQGTLNSAEMASRLFTSDEMRRSVNQVVHAAVRADLSDFASGCRDICFVETAIPCTSHLDEMCDEIWMVDAPRALRLARAMNRDKVSAGMIERRMRSQANEFECLPSDKCRSIVNDDIHSLIVQVDSLLSHSV